MAPVTAMAGATPTSAATSSVRPTKLFVGGITRHTTTKLLRDHFLQYGRVLDCVAMREADGCPRGFGYVTLDSPSAAAQCLAEPQVIDGRVVDMKLAVPEGSKGANAPSRGGGSKAASHGGSHGGHSHPAPSAFSWSNASAGASWWPLGYAGHGGAAPDIVDMLCGQGPAAESDAAAHFSLFSGYTQGSAGLSAQAPAFVPSAADDLLARSIRPQWHQPLLQRPEPALVRVPLGGLRYDTNSQAQGLDAMDEKLAPSGFRALEPAVISTESLMAGCAILEPSAAEAASVGRDSDEEVGENATPSLLLETLSLASLDTTATQQERKGQLVSPVSIESVSSNPQSPTARHSTGLLPSAGSALHAAGECRRCNFFSKGRCLNGVNCVFCHLPHEKRKPTRQEKRERRAAWMALQGVQTGCRVEVPGLTHDDEAPGWSAAEIDALAPEAQACGPSWPAAGAGDPASPRYSTVPPPQALSCSGLPMLPPGLPPPPHATCAQAYALDSLTGSLLSSAPLPASPVSPRRSQRCRRVPPRSQPLCSSR